MNKETQEALTQGLLAGYGGISEFTTVNRGGFELKSSHFESGDVVYHDEWTKRGGQEIVGMGDKLWTRVYAGGVASETILSGLGITKEDVIGHLKSRIQELGDKTRLCKNCFPDKQDEWGYQYEILDQDATIATTTGKETITYKDQTVFVHCFVIF